MLSDLRLAVRSLARAPLFALSIILILALGVGANTGAFSALYTLLLKPLPYPEPQRLVALHETGLDHKPRGVAEGNLLDWRVRTTAFEAMAVYQPRSFGLTQGEHDSVAVIQTGMVMAGFFDVLKVTPAMGREFREDEEFAEAHLMVLTSRLWHNQFGGDPAVIGRVIYLNEEPYMVIGVMPAGFEYLMDRVLPDAFIPLSHKDYCCGRVGSQSAIGRIRPGASLERARAELEAAAAGLAADYPATNRGRSAGLEPLAEAMRGNRREPLLLLLSAAFLLLAIACANVTGLVLARCLARSHEIAIRTALGAGVRRIWRQFLAEAAVLSVAGAAMGLFAARLVLRIAPAFLPGAAQAEPLRLDPLAFGIALFLALGVTMLLAGVPTLWVRGNDLAGVIKAAGRQSTRGSRSALRGALVVTQIALSVTLLSCTGLLLRSFFHLIATGPGFETAHALEFGIGLPEKRYDTALKEIEFHRELAGRLAALPGVASVGAANRLPLRGPLGPGSTFQFWGENLPARQRHQVWGNAVTPGYFAAMSVPLMEGRDFSWRDDRPGLQRVVIVNQAFVRAYLPGRVMGTLLEAPHVGELSPRGSPWEIVGVVGDTHQSDLNREPVPEIFVSVSQVGMDGGGYVIRARVDDAALPRAIARTVAELDPRIEQARVKRLDFVIDRVMEGRTAAIRTVGAFGGLALMLTAVGVYGIVAFRVTERSREMAIRMALGSRPREIRNLVLGHSLRLAAVGTAAGLALFGTAIPLWKSQLYHVRPADPLTIGAVTVAVLAVAVGASLGPSRRASRSAPADLLRDS